MIYLKLIGEIEATFWIRAIFIRPLMGGFIVLLLLFLATNVAAVFPIWGLWWWFAMLATFIILGFFMPMLLYLTNPKPFCSRKNTRKKPK